MGGVELEHPCRADQPRPQPGREGRADPHPRGRQGEPAGDVLGPGLGRPHHRTGHPADDRRRCGRHQPRLRRPERDVRQRPDVAVDAHLVREKDARGHARRQLPLHGHVQRVRRGTGRVLQPPRARAVRRFVLRHGLRHGVLQLVRATRVLLADVPRPDRSADHVLLQRHPHRGRIHIDGACVEGDPRRAVLRSKSVCRPRQRQRLSDESPGR